MSLLPDRQRYHSAHHPAPPVSRPAGRHPALPRASALRPAALQRAAEASRLPAQLVDPPQPRDVRLLKAASGLCLKLL
ncbi:hypothetical protein M9458_021280, partial [Cirrhinus mrigala]